MNANTIGVAAALLLGSTVGYAPAAQAGDVSNASLACYVDTTAFDQLTSGSCFSGWTPSQPDPSVAYFEVVGLTPGSYTFAWSASQCSSTSNWCTRPIRKDTSGGQPVTLSVTVTDNATGASKTVQATAEYIDIWS